MDFENIHIASEPISIATYTNYKEAVFLISVLNEPDLYGRIIPEETGEKYHRTIIGYPVVAKLKTNAFGKPVDFGGHELTVTKTKSGKKKRNLGTFPIGSVIDSWIEERDVDGYEKPVKCILIKCKLWTSRFPEYFKVFDKLWEEGTVQSSWELTSSNYEKKGKFTIYKVLEFIGNCCLGSLRKGAVPGAGAIEYAELDDIDAELADALAKDIAGLDIEGIEEKEDVDLADSTKKNAPVDDTEKKDGINPETVDETGEAQEAEKEKDETAACGGGSGSSKKKKTKVAEAEAVNDDADHTENADTAALTDQDLFSRIQRACETALNGWGFISYWFPEDHVVWFRKCDAPSALDFKLFTYVVTDDKVTVSEPEDVKLSVGIESINDVIAEKDSEIGALKAELEIKDQAVINAGEKINKLNVEISELIPFKEQVETAEKQRIELEIAEEKESLKRNMLKTGLFTEDEIAQPEISELIESRKKTEVNNLIAERYIASFSDEESGADEDAETISKPIATASLDVDDIDDDPTKFMNRILFKK